MPITEKNLRIIAPQSPNIKILTIFLNKFFQAYDINTPPRIAAFLALSSCDTGAFRLFIEGGALNEQLDYYDNIVGDRINIDKACHDACTYWHKNNLNTLADEGLLDSIIKTINGKDSLNVKKYQATYHSMLECLTSQKLDLKSRIASDSPLFNNPLQPPALSSVIELSNASVLPHELPQPLNPESSSQTNTLPVVSQQHAASVNPRVGLSRSRSYPPYPFKALPQSFQPLNSRTPVERIESSTDTYIPVSISICSVM